MTSLYGLVLTGGRSRRMQADKAALAYGSRPQLALAFDLLSPRVDAAWISVRADQAADALRARFPQIVDGSIGEGPIAGIVAAQGHEQTAAWLILACDLPFLDGATLDRLIADRDPARQATAFRSVHDGLPEPLCAIYEPASREPILRYVAAGGSCPRRFLLAQDTLLLDPVNAQALDNANTPQDLAAVRAAFAASGAG
ncbi:MAG TPA: NTP transferase domain-containing protein [Steroidobacteraceae bacterium]|nr:NTP transferase domain-containing protein [Steroidobacteraceae bacterium]